MQVRVRRLTPLLLLEIMATHASSSWLGDIPACVASVTVQNLVGVDKNWLAALCKTW